MEQIGNRGSILGSWWITIDRYLLFAIMITLIFSVIMVTTASPAVAERIGLNSFYFIKKQLVFILLGIIVMYSISFCSHEMIRRIALLGLIFFIALMVIVLVKGQEIKGARRWISLGFLAIQPSEFIKPFLTVLTASILVQKYVSPSLHSFKLSTLLYLLVVGLIVMQPDFGMAITISAVWGGQMFLAGLSMAWIIFLAVGAISGLIIAYMMFPHVAIRINSFLDPEISDNYQIKKSLEAFTKGGFFGSGPGEGIVKQHLPDSHTDFIFAVIGEELGMITCLIIIALYAFYCNSWSN